MATSNAQQPELKAANDSRPPGPFGAPIWLAGFRPFYLLGALYAPISLIAWITASQSAWFDSTWTPGLFHGHEMLFGFTAAVVAGFILTALPSWANIDHIDRGPLALLAGAWLVGRVAVWASPTLSPTVVGVADCALYALMIVLVTPGLLRAKDKRYLILLPIMLALLAANSVFHIYAATGDTEIAGLALEAALYTYMVLFTIVGGLLTPIFTEASLRKGDGTTHGGGWTGHITFIPGLEYAAVAIMIGVGITGLTIPGTPAAGSVALAALIVLGWRMARWQTHLTFAIPIIWVMHFAFAWLLVALAFRAFNDFSGIADHTTAFHAFTLGSLGMMKIGLMTRVVLRHTGRPVIAKGSMIAAYLFIALATLLRLVATGETAESAIIMGSAALWGLAYAIYAIEFGGMLVRPSLPRTPPPARPTG